jgi:hypothetical protein
VSRSAISPSRSRWSCVDIYHFSLPLIQISFPLNSTLPTDEKTLFIMARYTSSVTTIFTPDPTCYASSNLWLPENTYGCGTYYAPFEPRPTERVELSACDFPRLGPPPATTEDATHSACYQSNPYTTGGTAYSDCPVGMTPAATNTLSWVPGITLVYTTCCPT